VNRPVRYYGWVSGKVIDIFREYGADGWMNKYEEELAGL